MPTKRLCKKNSCGQRAAAHLYDVAGGERAVGVPQPGADHGGAIVVALGREGHPGGGTMTRGPDRGGDVCEARQGKEAVRGD